MADANRVIMAYVKESVFGQVPAGPPTLQEIRLVSEGVRKDTRTVVSNELRSDRQVPDVVRVGLAASGPIAFELSYGAFDDWFLSVLQHGAAWVAAATVTATDISATGSDQSLNSVAGDFTSPSFDAGRIIKVSGFTGSGTTANGYKRIVNRVSDFKIIVQGESAIVDDAAGESVTVVAGAYARNGVTLDSYSTEVEHTDLANVFEQGLGQCFDGLSLQFTPEQIVTGTFDVIGKDKNQASSTIGTGTNNAAPSNDVLNAVDHIQEVWEGAFSVTGGALGTDLVNMDLQLRNNLRARLQLGTLGAISIGSGRIDLTGTIRKYLEDTALLAKYHGYTASGLGLAVQDAAGNGYFIDMPKVRFTQGGAPTEGINTDVMVDLQYTAIREPTLNFTVSVTRFPAP